MALYSAALAELNPKNGRGHGHEIWQRPKFVHKAHCAFATEPPQGQGLHVIFCRFGERLEVPHEGQGLHALFKPSSDRLNVPSLAHCWTQPKEPLSGSRTFGSTFTAPVWLLPWQATFCLSQNKNMRSDKRNKQQKFNSFSRNPIVADMKLNLVT